MMVQSYLNIIIAVVAERETFPQLSHIAELYDD